MPEGPEIRRAADALNRVLRARTALTVRFAAEKFPHLQTFGERLSGQVVRGIEPRGKALLTHFDNGLTIYSHNQLYGEWRVFRGSAPPSHLQTRLTIVTVSHTAILYSASEISVLPTAAVPQHPYIAKLGVELLDATTRLSDVVAQVSAPQFARRTLAALLLDQGFLAGIGNYLRSDILFVARLHPAWRPADLSPAQRHALARAALHLTRRSLRTRGITNEPTLGATSACALATQGWPYERYRHWIFDREGEACHICAGVIVREMIAGRQLFRCGRCQAH